MKKCPYCSKELLDNAEFCLYCMRPLNLKNAKEHKIKRLSLKSALMIFLPLAAVLFAVTAIIIFKPKSGGNVFTAGKLTNSKYESTNKDLSQNGDLTDKNSSRDTTHSDAQISENFKGRNSELSENGDVPASESKSQAAGKSSSSSSSKAASSKTSSNSISSASSESSSSQASQTEAEKQTFSFKAVSGGIEITGIANENASGEYSIPDTIDGKPVISIGERAFYNNKKIKSIILPETLKTINDHAFSGCTSISRITIPKSVIKIGNSAFSPCNNLSAVYIASTDISVDNYAFSNSYNRKVELTIYAPSSTGLKDKAKMYWSAKYVEWNG